MKNNLQIMEKPLANKQSNIGVLGMIIKLLQGKAT